jgi:hypothetical protein
MFLRCIRTTFYAIRTLLLLAIHGRTKIRTRHFF